MTTKTLKEEHKEDYDKLLMEEFKKGKLANLTQDEKLEEEVRKEGIEEEEEILDESETADEKVEKEILEEEVLEEILEADSLFENQIKAKSLNNFLINQSYDASLSDIQPIMNLEEELEEIPLEEKEDEPDFSYKHLGEEEDDPYRAVVQKYESENKDQSGPPQIRDTPEQRLEMQGKMYGADKGPIEDKDNKFIQFKQPKERDYGNISSKARRGIY